MELIRKFKDGKQTDADRARLTGYDHAKALGGWDLAALENELKERGGKDEKKHFFESATYHDAIRPYLLSRDKKEEADMPLIYDLRRQLYGASICYVNGGANDFNSANSQTGLCPSIMVAVHFINAMNYENKVEANDLLYIYKKLKEKGLNQDLIKSYVKKHPEVQITESLKQMDALLAIPEEERFRPKAQKAPQKSKGGIWRRIWGGRRGR